MCHNFFIHSSVSEHLDCFHVLAIVNSAAENIGIHVSFLKNLFVLALSCSMWDLPSSLQHVGSFFFVLSCGMWSGSQARDGTPARCIGSSESQPLDHQGSTHVFMNCSFLIVCDSSVGKESAYNAGDPGLSPGLGRFAGEELGYPLQYSWACGSAGKNSPAMQRPGFYPWVGKILWRRERLPTAGFLPGEFHGLYSPWGP